VRGLREGEVGGRVGMVELEKKSEEGGEDGRRRRRRKGSERREKIEG